MSSETAWIRVRMRRRSVSSFVSPGPRVPMPPPSRDSAAPGPDEPRQQILELRELHLQLAFAGPRAPGKDVENELRAIDDLPADLLFDLPQLRRRQLVVEDDDVDVGFGGGGGQRGDLAGAEKRRRIRLGALLHHPQHHLGARGFGEAGELVERSLGIEPARPARNQADERRALAPAAPRGCRGSRRAIGRASRRRVVVIEIEPCLYIVPRNRACPDELRHGAGDVDDRRGCAARRRARVDQQIHIVAERPLDFVGIRRRRLAAAVGAGRGDGPLGAPADRACDVVRGNAHADASGAAGDVAGQRRRRGHEQRQRTRPELLGQPPAVRRQRTEARRT